MGTLNLPVSEASAVWKLVRARLKADTALAGAGITLLFFEGDRETTAALSALPAPAVVFVAGLGRMGWFDERAQSGGLLVSYMTVLDGLDDEDPLDLQRAIETALYPDDGFAFQQSLVEAGATTGQPLFSSPLNQSPASAGKEGLFTPTGQFTIDVVRGYAP